MLLYFSLAGTGPTNSSITTNAQSTEGYTDAGYANPSMFLPNLNLTNLEVSFDGQVKKLYKSTLDGSLIFLKTTSPKLTFFNHDMSNVDWTINKDKEMVDNESNKFNFIPMSFNMTDGIIPIEIPFQTMDEYTKNYKNPKKRQTIQIRMSFTGVGFYGQNGGGLSQYSNGLYALSCINALLKYQQTVILDKNNQVRYFANVDQI